VTVLKVSDNFKSQIDLQKRLIALFTWRLARIYLIKFSNDWIIT